MRREREVEACAEICIRSSKSGIKCQFFRKIDKGRGTLSGEHACTSHHKERHLRDWAGITISLLRPSNPPLFLISVCLEALNFIRTPLRNETIFGEIYSDNNLELRLQHEGAQMWAQLKEGEPEIIKWERWKQRDGAFLESPCLPHDLPNASVWNVCALHTHTRDTVSSVKVPRPHNMGSVCGNGKQVTLTALA